MAVPDFASWKRENINKFAQEAYVQLQELEGRGKEPEMPTLRDMFAMFALIGMTDMSPGVAAHEAFLVADSAMERRKL